VLAAVVFEGDVREGVRRLVPALVKDPGTAAGQSRASASSGCRRFCISVRSCTKAGPTLLTCELNSNSKLDLAFAGTSPPVRAGPPQPCALNSNSKLDLAFAGTSKMTIPPNLGSMLYLRSIRT